MRPEASGPLAERQQGINLHAPFHSRKSWSRGYGARRCGATDPPACRKTPSAHATHSERHGNDLRIDIEKTAYRRVATGRQPKPQKTTVAHTYQDSAKHHGSHKPTRPCPCVHRTEPVDEILHGHVRGCHARIEQSLARMPIGEILLPAHVWDGTKFRGARPNNRTAIAAPHSTTSS